METWPYIWRYDIVPRAILWKFISSKTSTRLILLAISVACLLAFLLSQESKQRMSLLVQIVQFLSRSICYLQTPADNFLVKHAEISKGSRSLGRGQFARKDKYDFSHRCLESKLTWLYNSDKLKLIVFSILLAAGILFLFPKNTFAQSIDDIQFGKDYSGNVSQENIPKPGNIEPTPYADPVQHPEASQIPDDRPLLIKITLPFVQGINNVKNWFGDRVQDVKNGVENIGNTLFETGEKVIDFGKNTFNIFGGLKDAVVGTIKNITNRLATIFSDPDVGYYTKNISFPRFTLTNFLKNIFSGLFAKQTPKQEQQKENTLAVQTPLLKHDFAKTAEEITDHLQKVDNNKLYDKEYSHEENPDAYAGHLAKFDDPDKMPEAIKDVYKLSKNWNPDNFPENYVECTAFVYMVYKLEGITLPQGMGNAEEWSHSDKDITLADGTKTKIGKVFDIHTNGKSSEPIEVGDIMVWDERHVGVVGEVNKVSKSIVIYNANSDQTSHVYPYVFDDSGNLTIVGSSNWSPDHWMRLKKDEKTN